MRLYPKRKAVFFATFLFAVVHLDPLDLNLHEVVDVISVLHRIALHLSSTQDRFSLAGYRLSLCT
jgi:hypothetical protein